MKKHYREENDCLNCGATLQGKFCHVCGQENLELKENFGHMMNHAISDYFHFDHQFFHTLKPLLFKPGFLTNQYLAGKRAQYLHPVKMYIFISIVYFLLFFKTGHDVVKLNETTNNPAKTEKSLDSAKKAIAANAYIPASAKKQIIKDLDKSKIDEKKDKVIDNQNEVEKGPNKWFRPTTKDTSFSQYLANQQKLPKDKQDNILEKIWNHKVYSYTGKYGSQAREMFVEDIQHNTPKMMFLLLPLFALILRVAFWKNRRYYVEYLIYSFHFHCFLFLFLGILILIAWPFPVAWGVADALNFIAFLYVTWYVYKSLRIVYQRSWFRTITKMIGMSVMYFCSFVLCIMILFIATTLI